MALKNRNIVVCILLSFVTCGIYLMYWNFCMAKEAVSVKDANEGTLEGVLCLFGLTAFIGWYLAEQKFTEGLKAQGIEHNDNSIMYLVIALFCPIVVSVLMQNEINKLVPVQ